MCPASASQSPSAPLRIWALIGPKHGDNAQVRALAARLASIACAEVEEHVLAFHGGELLVHAWPAPTRLGLAPGQGRSLEPPWPDLVIGAGRRSEPVARWIRRASGARTRLVHLGRPWAHPRHFDLVVSSAQYRLAQQSGVIECALPLIAPAPAEPTDPGGAERAADIAGFTHLPRPWTGVLLGGNSGYLIFDATRARALARALAASRVATGGSLIMTASPRTPPAFLDVLEAELAGGSTYMHRWSPGGRNPYRAILEAADTLVVTSDSVSMVVEAQAAGRPVYLFDVRPRGHDWWRHAGEYRWRALSHRLVQAIAPTRFRRDVRRIYERLVAEGAVRWLDGVATPYQPTVLDPEADLERVAARVLALFALEESR